MLMPLTMSTSSLTIVRLPNVTACVTKSAECGVRSAECGVRSAECLCVCASASASIRAICAQICWRPLRLRLCLRVCVCVNPRHLRPNLLAASVSASVPPRLRLCQSAPSAPKSAGGLGVCVCASASASVSIRAICAQICWRPRRLRLCLRVCVCVDPRHLRPNLLAASASASVPPRLRPCQSAPSAPKSAGGLRVCIAVRSAQRFLDSDK